MTVDEAARAELIHTALDLMAADWAMLPLVQYPRSGIWQTEKVGGPVDQDLDNYQAFQNINEWEDVDGDGRIVIGAEQWPGCLNPVTECANSSWYLWTTAFKVLPVRVGHDLGSDVRDHEPRGRRTGRRDRRVAASRHGHT